MTSSSHTLLGLLGLFGLLGLLISLIRVIRVIGVIRAIRIIRVIRVYNPNGFTLVVLPYDSYKPKNLNNPLITL